MELLSIGCVHSVTLSQKDIQQLRDTPPGNYRNFGEGKRSWAVSQCRASFLNQRELSYFKFAAWESLSILSTSECPHGSLFFFFFIICNSWKYFSAIFSSCITTKSPLYSLWAQNTVTCLKALKNASADGELFVHLFLASCEFGTWFTFMHSYPLKSHLLIWTYLIYIRYCLCPCAIVKHQLNMMIIFN